MRKCDNCNVEKRKLIEIGDVDSTAYISSQLSVPITEYTYICSTCLFQLLGLTEEDFLTAKINASNPGILLQEIEAQKSLMIGVATGGPRIDDVNQEYKERRLRIKVLLNSCIQDDPNPFSDLWGWFEYWKNEPLPTYQSRREHINELYADLIDALSVSDNFKSFIPEEYITGWERVDRNIKKIRLSLSSAKNEEDFQSIGLLCREAMISLAQAVFDPDSHKKYLESEPSKTDARRMLEGFISAELSGNSNEELKRHTKSTLALANTLQHKRTATRKDAELCVEATRTIINLIAIISDVRITDPDTDDFIF